MSRFREMFANKDFTFLWLGQIISNFGDRLNQMALVALVYQRNPGSEMALAKLISFTIIPVFIVGPIAGVWVDRFDRRKVMIFSDLIRGILVLFIPLFIYINQILPIYFIIFLTFSLSRFFIPSKMAIIPDIVSKENLLMANTLQGTTNMIGNVAGLVVAGIIVNIRFIGAVGGFYIDALTFFISASLLSMMTRASVAKDLKNGIFMTAKALKNSVRMSVLAEIKEGFGYLTNFKNMRLVMGSFFLLMAGLGTISCVIIVFIQNAFGTSTRDLGFIGMFFVAGLFLGTLIF
nr:MFS transporter [Candidatus Omnitrophota bacterium]